MNFNVLPSRGFCFFLLIRLGLSSYFSTVFLLGPLPFSEFGRGAVDRGPWIVLNKMDCKKRDTEKSFSAGDPTHGVLYCVLVVHTREYDQSESCKSYYNSMFGIL